MAVATTGAIYKSLSFDGVESRNFGVYITGEAVYNAPERDVEMVSIPGRSGAFALDKGRFENIEVTYPAGIFADNETDFAKAVSDFRNYLCSRKGYCRLVDEYNPEEYRMAIYKSGLEVTPAQLKAGEFKLVFDCKPQRWLTSGEEAVTIGEYVEVAGTDNEPYLFRASPQFSDEYDTEIDKIVGGTVAWNQILQNGNFANSSNWSGTDATFSVSNNVCTFTASAKNGYIRASYSQITGHKIFATASIKTTAVGAVQMVFGSTAHTTTLTNQFETLYHFEEADTTAKIYFPRIRDTRASGWDAVEVKNVMVFDLTQMFGSTIADYIYSLEQATAGAGVNFFKKLGFNKPYYAYNAGELKSVSGLVSHDMTGFNQLPTPTSGSKHGITFTVNADGTVTTSGTATSTNMYSLGEVELIGGNTYEICGCPSGGGSGKYGLRLIDANGSAVAADWGSGATYTPTANETVQVVISYWYNYAVNGTFEPCLHLAWDGSRNGEYEPYELHSYPLDSDLTLRGIPKLDANNNLYYDGDIYAPSGEVTRKYGIVDLGTLTWSYNSTNSAFYSVSFGAKRATNGAIPSLVCTPYLTITCSNAWADFATKADKSVTLHLATSVVDLAIKDSAYTDAATFKTAMSGVYLVYELATPTTETADAYQTPQIVNDFGTEEYVSTSIVPVGHDTQYGENPNVLVNPTLFESSPLIVADGYGAINFNEYTINIEDIIVGDVPIASQQTVNNNNVSVEYDDKAATFSSGDQITIKNIVLRSSMTITTAAVFIEEQGEDDRPMGIIYWNSPNTDATLGYSCSGKVVSFSMTIPQITLTIGVNQTLTYKTRATVKVQAPGQAWERNSEYATTTIKYSNGKIKITAQRLFLDSGYLPTAGPITQNSITIGAINGYSTTRIEVGTKYIDCDLGEAYLLDGDASVNLNQHIDLGSDLPKLASGPNAITYDNTITDLKFLPRWWKV